MNIDKFRTADLSELKGKNVTKMTLCSYCGGEVMIEYKQGEDVYCSQYCRDEDCDHGHRADS